MPRHLAFTAARMVAPGVWEIKDFADHEAAGEWIRDYTYASIAMNFAVPASALDRTLKDSGNG